MSGLINGHPYDTIKHGASRLMIYAQRPYAVVLVFVFCLFVIILALRMLGGGYGEQITRSDTTGVYMRADTQSDLVELMKDNIHDLKVLAQTDAVVAGGDASQFHTKEASGDATGVRANVTIDGVETKLRGNGSIHRVINEQKDGSKTVIDISVNSNSSSDASSTSDIQIQTNSDTTQEEP